MIPFKDDNPTRTFPGVTIFFIGINISVFLLQLKFLVSGHDLASVFGAIPRNLLSIGPTRPIAPIYTVFTSMFMHGSLLHIAGNMLFFWIFGNNIEDRLGHFRFILFYLFCGIVAAYAHALTSPNSKIPMVGASGAISGVLGAYLLLFPRAKVHTLIFFGFFFQVVRVPALIVIGFWAIIQLVNGMVTQGAQQAGVAWFAHIGGFLAGLFTIKLWLPKRRFRWL